MGGAALRREQNRIEMRQSILDVAGRLLTGKGPAAVSMRAIAREMGYSPAALYEYFSGIEEILTALYFEGVGGLDGRMRTALAEANDPQSAIAKIRALGRTYRDYAHSHPELFRLQFSENKVSTMTHGDDGSRPGFGLLIQALEEGIASGEVIDRPANPLALFCWSSVHGFVSLENSSHIDTAANDEVFEFVLDCTIRGIAATPNDTAGDTTGDTAGGASGSTGH
jgi:AcrR family transcriptional regulator